MGVYFIIAQNEACSRPTPNHWEWITALLGFDRIPVKNHRPKVKKWFLQTFVLWK